MLVWRLTLYQKIGGIALFVCKLPKIKVLEQKRGSLLTLPFTKEESYRMIDNTHNLNRQIAVTMAICTTFLICLLLLDFFAVFNFSEELMFAISVIGIPTLISPLILCFFKVPDKFLKYYMSVAMSVLIGMFGCFNDIGIYITFVLVPVASCLYFDVYYTMFCSVFSYIVMVISVYLNSAGRLEIGLPQSHWL